MFERRSLHGKDQAKINIKATLCLKHNASFLVLAQNVRERKLLHKTFKTFQWRLGRVGPDLLDDIYIYIYKYKYICIIRLFVKISIHFPSENTVTFSEF